MGAQGISLRVVGACSKGPESPKVGGFPQRAKCGFRLSCTRFTHALIPATYDAGSFDRRKANAVRFWQMRGPMASRTHAAAVYLNQFKYLPSGWDWIATKHEAMLPPASDSAALRTADVSEQPESQSALEDSRSSRPAPIPPSPAPLGFHPASKAPRSGNPPSSHSPRESNGPIQVGAPRVSLLHL